MGAAEGITDKVGADRLGWLNMLLWACAAFVGEGLEEVISLGDSKLRLPSVDVASNESGGRAGIEAPVAGP